MKPVRVTFFVLITIATLGVIALLFPAEGVKMGDFTLHFPTLAEIFNPNPAEYADISALQLAADTVSEPVEPAGLSEDTITGGFPINLVEISELKTRHLEFPDGRRSVLYPFFRKLDSLAVVRKQVRILHYGDSQIEGDRITHLLRRKFQSQFGGSGPGIVPVVELYNSQAVKRSLSGNWQRFTLFGPGGKVPHTKYGAMASFSRFRPVVHDSLANDSVLYSASVTFTGSGYPFSQCRVFAGNAQAPVGIEINSGGSTVKADSISGALQIITAGTSGSDVTITFTGYDSPDIYGVDLSGGAGVMVDNLPMRGSSGTVFTRINAAQLQQMYSALNVELFILQFGGNVMPYIKNEQECANYGNWFYSQMMLLKRVRPSACIIVIGPSDMSIKDKENYVTYPLLESVRDALKEATFKAGGAYWDMYEAMGGRNSMPSWVAANPPLAATDYTHFSPRGARLIGDMFYNALIWEYQLYRKAPKQQKEKSE
jgi:lysophospholipase L1-like esterase